jgi:hypothetical protein
MGHGYGLNHAYETLNKREYGNPYDIMSWDVTDYWFTGTLGVPCSHSTNGVCPATSTPEAKAVTGPSVNAPDLQKLGWIPDNRIYAYDFHGTKHITLAPLEAPNEAGFLMVQFSFRCLLLHH